jgi:FtsP/CotA-like multicopper oxidase with cupredoxin domain
MAANVRFCGAVGKDMKATVLSRRGWLGGVAVGALALATGVAQRPTRAGAAYDDGWLDLAQDELSGPLPELPATVDADGVRRVLLRAAALPSQHPLARVLSAAYEESVPGPLLRLTPGRRTRVELVNDLADQETSLHLHGLLLSPGNDAPLLSVPPGGRHVYDVTLPESAGTYWYHPHVHGIVEPQMRMGLTGAMVVDPEHLPAPVDGTAEQLLVLTHLVDARHVLVNGHRRPVVRPPAGRTRLRIVNTGTFRSLSLQIVDQGTPLPLWRVASDAGWLERAVLQRGVTLPPAGRAEVLVDLPPRACSLVALPRGGDSDGGEVVVLATLVGTAGTPAAPPTGALSAVPRLVAGPHVRHRRLVFGARADGRSFTIDGRTFDHRRTDVKVPLGHTEVWHLVNTTELEHPFHLHSYPFQLLAVGGRRPRTPAWLDVAVIPPRATMSIGIPWHRYPGLTVFHCHNVIHEDAGMMATVRIGQTVS